jgi:hypothetical protein
LTLQNHVWTHKKNVWTADRIEKRGRQNCGLCKLWNEIQELAAHIFFNCRFTIRVLSILRACLGLHDIDTRDWHAIPTVKDWLVQVVHERGGNEESHCFFQQASFLGDMEGKKWQGIPQSSNTSTVLASKIKDN